MPEYVFVTTRKPTRDGDAGAIEEGWYDLEADGYVQMKTQAGVPLSGKKNRQKPRKGQTPKECAWEMLRAKVRAKPLSPFSRKLFYRPTGWM
jgi:hypothetical protein